MTDNDAKLTVYPRAEAGRFAKGGSGRPVGAKGKFSREALQTVLSYGPEALHKLLGAVRSGERWAVEFVLTRVLPTGRTIQFEDITPDDISQAIADGDISAIEARDISTAMAKLAEIGEIEIIKSKLAELEAALNAKG